MSTPEERALAAALSNRIRTVAARTPLGIYAVALSYELACVLIEVGAQLGKTDRNALHESLHRVINEQLAIEDCDEGGTTH